MKLNKRTIVWLVVGLMILIVYFVGRPYYSFLTKTLKISILKTFFSFNGVKKVNDSVNILILGIPGGKHDGPNLSDSIVVANYNFTKNRLVTIGIPRDVWSDTLRDKINSAYAYGESKVVGGGIKLARAEVAAIVDTPIQYGAVINFSNFKDIIDYVGGVDVNVQRSFVDKKFPIEGREDDLCGGDPEYGCRYEIISFEKGKQHMDGATALKFVRSRNAEGAEGSDFARTQRQQEVISSLKAEVVDTVKSLNINKIRELYLKFNSLITRDISNQEVAIVARKIIFNKGFNQKNFHIPNEMFFVPDYRLYDGKYVLVPDSEDFGRIHAGVRCILEKEDQDKCLPLKNE